MAAVESLSRAMKDLLYQKNYVREEIHLAEREGRAVTDEVEAWLEKTSSIEAEVSDFIDEYNSRPRCLYCSFFKDFSVINKASTMRAEVERLMAQSNFNKIAFRPLPLAVQEIPRPDSSVGLGIKFYLKKIRDYVEDEKTGVVGIWGMGGVGKTHLLMNVNNAFLHKPSGGGGDFDFNFSFDFIIWLTVSRDYNAKRLQSELCRRVGLDIWEEASLSSQASAIFNALKNKKVLLLLDDLWEPVDLQRLGIPDPHSGGSHRIKVIFTTRSRRVCYMMEADEDIRMDVLNDEDAWQLFRMKVGGDAIDSPQIEMLAKEVVRECGGLPLAILTIGRAMSYKKTIQEWRHVVKMLHKSRINDVPGMDDHLLSMLRITYDSLPDDITKRCFLCCSYWPKDSIRKDELIECWMGLGLIDDFDDIDEAFLKGQFLIENLKGMSLLERGDDEDQEVKMHDLIRDMALWIGSEEGEVAKKCIVRVGEGLHTVTEEEADRWIEAETISLMDNEIEALPMRPDCPKLRTLLLRRNRRLEKIPDTFFISMHHLSYLDLSRTGLEELPEEIGMLFMLEYLNLSHTPIRELPQTIGRLQRLKYLHLSRTWRLRAIARGVISHFYRLRLLDLYKSEYAHWDDEAAEILEELAVLGRRLKALGITVETISALQQLSSLVKLCKSLWRLSITRLEGPVLRLSQNLLWTLHHLSIEGCKRLEELVIGVEDIHEAMKIQQDAWHPSLTVLEKLELHQLPKLTHLTWTVPSHVLFPRLRYLRISSCNHLNNVSWVLQLPSLEVLVMALCDEIEEVISHEEDDSSSKVLEGGADTTFPSLKKLILEDLPKLHHISGREIMAYPSLVLVEVLNCPRLKGLPSETEAPLMVVRQISSKEEEPSFKDEPLQEISQAETNFLERGRTIVQGRATAGNLPR